MSKQDTIYQLRIIQATNLQPTKHKHIPNAFVEVGLTGFKYKTKVIKGSRAPCWNEEIQFIARSESTVLYLNVKHSSVFPFGNGLIGTYHAELGDLVRKCEDGKEVELELSGKGHHHTTEAIGQIKIMLCVPNADVAAASAIAVAHKDAGTVGTGAIATVTGYIDEAQGVISTQSSMFGGLESVLAKIDVFVKIVDETANVHPYSKMAWQIVSSVYKIVRKQISTDKKLHSLIATMERVYSFVDVIQSNISDKVDVLAETIKRIFSQTIECAIFIREYTNHGFAVRTLQGTVKDDNATIDRLSQGLLMLKEDFDSGVAIHTAIASVRTERDVTAILRKQTLLELAPAELDASGRPACHPSTRQNVLSEITDWATNPSCEQNVLWYHGLAGSGKSTISTTIANTFRELRRLGAFIFFDRTHPEQSHPSKVIRTLAYKLGSFDQRIGAAICSAIDNFPSVNDASPRVQFMKLIVEPLATLTDILAEGPIVLVFDAIDECGNPEEREPLLNVLATELGRLPSTIRVLITSRQLEDISNAFEGQPNILSRDMDVSSDSSSRDISTYLKYQFEAIRKRARLPSEWPGEEAAQDLVTRSCGLFVWATTVVNIINSYNPPKRLAIILRGEIAPGAQSALDDLYKRALEQAGRWDDEDFVEHIRSVLGTILVLQNPLTTSTLDQLIEDGRSNDAVLLLACVIAIEPTVHLLHPSFADFLFSRARSGRDMWYFDAAAYHQKVTLKCLDLLSNGSLKRNTCNLTLSVAPEGQTVSDDIAYASLFWINHICSTSSDDQLLVEHLEAFLNKHLLHWFEVMSILGKSKDTIPLLDKLHRWIMVKFPNQHHLLDFVGDAWRFAQTFGTFIEDHSLLVYFGALPFAPTTSIIYQTFHDPQLYPTISGGFSRSWSGRQLVLSHTAPVVSVACSPNGAHIVTGSGGQIRVWNAASGAQVVPPLDTKVTSVAFSPDGTRFISGSSDSNVYIWDTMSGTEVGPVLRGHELCVYSVAFARDGTRIVSGSDDKTVRVWDAVSGTEVFPALQGHEESVRSVAFSQDGTRIISGSYDDTVRVWDARSGTEVCTLRQPKRQGAMSIAFSPDGTRIVSSSLHNIRVWDVVSGTEVRSLLHEWVTSVAISPDGHRITSGSADGTVRVWDAASGNEIVPLMRKHHGVVHSVTFSPDGARIVSGSEDMTVCVWDAVSTTDMDLAFQGHSGGVNSVAFSPDRTRIVSGSMDTTVRVWDAMSGAEAVPPFRGHRLYVYSVAFSRDGARIVSGSYDNTVRVWDVATGAEIIVLQGESPTCYSAVAFSPDGTRIVSGSFDNKVQVWDVASGTQINSLEGHEDHVQSVAFSPDGTRIVSGSRDGTVRVWNTVSGTVIHLLQGHDTVESVVFSSDGTHIFSTSFDTICIWDAVTGLPSVSSGTQNPFRIVIYRGGRVVDTCQQRTISKLPGMVDWRCSASSGNSLCIGTKNGEVVILNFPDALLNGPETRPAEENSAQ